MTVSIIIPVLNEENGIYAMLQQLQFFRQQGHEVIVVDGGSHDKTCVVAAQFSDHVINTKPGRALQMNKGAEKARFDILWFLHADSIVNAHATEVIQQVLNDNIHCWGRFDITLSGMHWIFRIIETMMNLRSCITGIATGDHGIFVKRHAFDLIKGYADIPLMEDIDFSQKLKKISKPVCLKEKLVTSSRRWEKKGILTTVFLMWRLRFLYYIGISAKTLARQYQ